MKAFIVAAILASLSVVHAETPHIPARNRVIKLTADSLGLTRLGTQMSSGLAIGFHIDWMAGDRPQTLNDRLGKPASIIGGYVHLNTTNQTYWELDLQLPSILEIASTTVYTPAVLPQFSLDQWTDNMTTTLASQMQRLNAQGVTVWLRFAYEMNGDWMPFGHDPANYVRVWKDVYTAVKSVAPETYFLWAPNVKASDPTGTLDSYDEYYPGPGYVDIAGIDLYYLGGDQASNDNPPSDYFTTSFQSFYDLYSAAHPIIVAETSSPYHYLPGAQYQALAQDAELPGGADAVDFSTLTPADGDGSSEMTIKTHYFAQLASNATVVQFPKLAAVVWFNLAKIGGPLGTPLLNDFRIVKGGGNDTLTAYFRTQIGNDTAYSLGTVAGLPTSASTTASGTSSETFSGSKTTSTSGIPPAATKTGSGTAAGQVHGLVVAASTILGLLVMLD